MKTIILTKSRDITVPTNADYKIVWTQKAAGTVKSTITLSGPGARARIVGLFDLANDTVATSQFVIHHTAPHTSAEFLAKGVVRDRAVANFNGLIKIDPAAQDTTTKLDYHALILSPTAQANPTPALEILANDVTATHAATATKLDAEQLFYVQSRGISRARAKEVVTTAFIAPVLEQLPAKLSAQLK